MKTVKTALCALLWALVQLSVAQGTAKPVTSAANTNSQPVSTNPGKAAVSAPKPVERKAPRSIHISGKAPKLQKRPAVNKK